MTDLHLIEAHLTGDPSALSSLMGRHRSALMGFLRPRVGEDADDLYQEIWSRAAAALERYRDQGTFRAWLFQIARRRVIDHHRRGAARVHLIADETLDAEGDEPTGEAWVEARQLEAAIHDAMAELSPEAAEVVRLRLVDGMKFNDIARRQGVSLNTALSRMHRALRKLRGYLSAEGLLPPDRRRVS